MAKQDLSKFVKTAKRSISKHSPEILLALGIGGMFTAGILAVKATPKALQILEVKKREESKDELTKAEIVKATWKCYIPAVATATVSTACLIGSNSVSLKRNAALATAYQISQTAISEYKDKVVEVIGEKKEQVVKDKVAEKKVQEHPVTSSEVYVTKRGNTLCYDYMSGRYFESDIDLIKKAENTINARMLHDMFGYASLNEFYDEIGLDRVGIGDDHGWNVNNLVDTHLSSQIADDGRPCIVLGFNNAPVYGYDNLS